MPELSLRDLLRQRTLKVGTGFLEFDSPGIGQIARAGGVDFAFIDMEHSGFGIESVKRSLRYMQAAGLPAVVRPPTKAFHHIGQVLDAGADAVLVPMVETAEQARESLQAIKYYPEGRRGVALGIAHDRYRAGPMADTLAAANRKTAALMLIESVQGVANADEIAAVPGVDGLWLGALDLSCSLGAPGEFESSPRFLAAMQKVLSAAKAHNLNAGRLAGTPGEGIALFKLGFDSLCYSADIYLLRGAIAAGVTAIREGCK